MHLPDLLATLPAELRDYVRKLEAEASALRDRNQFLEEQFRLAQLKRFAPSSEKYGIQGCLFNEAEHEAIAPTPDDGDSESVHVNFSQRTVRPRACRQAPSHAKPCL